MSGLKSFRSRVTSRVTRPALIRGVRLLLPVTCGLWLLSSGCASNRPAASVRFAVVKLEGNTPGQICEMAKAVFGAHGYQIIQSDLSHMVFEKPAGALSNLTYGNWGDEPALTVRVKADVLPDGEQTYLFQCQAYVVRDRGGSLEEEIQISRHKSGSYQALLDEVANRLHSKASPPGQ